MIFLVPDVSVMVPLAGSTALTIPPTPFVCQSACSAACICAMSDDFIRITRTALNDAGVSPALPVTRMWSPAAISLNWTVVAAFKSVLPTGTCRIRAPGATVTAIVFPPSAAIVIELPETALTVPRSDSVEAAAAAAGAGAWATIEEPVTRKISPTPSEIVSKRHLFRVAICILILIQTGFWETCLPGQGCIEPQEGTGVTFHRLGRVFSA